MMINKKGKEKLPGNIKCYLIPRKNDRRIKRSKNKGGGGRVGKAPESQTFILTHSLPPSR